jgi:hypothetical protein
MSRPVIGVWRRAATAAIVAACGWAAGAAAEEAGGSERVVREIHLIGSEGAGAEWTRKLAFDGHGPWPGGGFLGVELTALTPELRLHFGAPEGAGVMVARVVEDSPAWRAGVRVGDIVTGIAGESVDGPASLAHGVRDRGGETVDLEVWRDGRLEQVAVALEERAATWPAMSALHLPCPDGEPCGAGRLPGWHSTCQEGDCRVTVRCEDDGVCACEVDGESRPCEELRDGED